LSLPTRETVASIDQLQAGVRPEAPSLDDHVLSPYALVVERSRQGKWAFGLTVGAFVWAVAIIPAAFLLPVYGSETISDAFPSGAAATAQHGSATLIGVNGASARLLIVLALPAVLAGVVWFSLHRECAGRRAPGRRTATGALVLLAALTLLTGFSIGSEMLPALLLLVIARSLTPTGGKHTPSALPT
jgi:hypothetical protein